MPPISRRVVWAPRVKRDLGDVWGYYARVASVEVADKLLREIDEAGVRLSENALRWRARDELIQDCGRRWFSPTSSSTESKTELSRLSASCMDAEISPRFFPSQRSDEARYII
jgi:plasmid stabilization system protein ParE